MDNSKRARSEKSRIQPRGGAYVDPQRLQIALERIRQANACASAPEVGAQCGSSARWDLCGGRRVTGVPTATDLNSTCPSNSVTANGYSRHLKTTSRRRPRNGGPTMIMIFTPSSQGTFVAYLGTRSCTVKSTRTLSGSREEREDVLRRGQATRQSARNSRNRADSACCNSLIRDFSWSVSAIDHKCPGPRSSGARQTSNIRL